MVETRGNFEKPRRRDRCESAPRRCEVEEPGNQRAGALVRRAL